jgi:hypothetical protein
MRFLGNAYSNADFEGLRTLVVPSGIGEFQWAWTKYINTGERFCILGLDGAPRRLHQFCELHPQIEAFGYTTAFDYTSIRQWMEYHRITDWASVTKKFSLGSMVPLACNPHLEAGNSLASWLPDLPTTYRYALSVAPEHVRRATRYLEESDVEDPVIGISCASYRGADAWKTWKAEEWITFLTLVQEEVPNVRFALLGGSWDDLTATVYDEAPQLRWLVDGRGFPPVGRTDFGTAVALLTRLHGYIGFSSGLGHVAAHNCDTPVFMLWPDHEQPLSRTWVDPELLENGTYVPSQWLAPKDVFRLAKPWLRRIQDVCHA